MFGYFGCDSEYPGGVFPQSTVVAKTPDVFIVNKQQTGVCFGGWLLIEPQAYEVLDLHLDYLSMQRVKLCRFL